MSLDFEDDAEEHVYSSQDLQELAILAEQQCTLERKKEELEIELAQVDQKLQRVSGVDIPAAMEAIGMSDFMLTSGERIKVERKVKASIPKARQNEAFDWLRKQGHDALIKNQVITNFGRGEDIQAKDLVEKLKKSGFVVDQIESVHAQTLGAFVREQLERGVELPHDLLGIFEYNVTKISKPKES